MLLQAPTSLRAFVIVERNIAYMLSVVPENWTLDPIFDGWSELAPIMVSGSAALAQDADVLDPACVKRKRLGQWIVVHPMEGHGLTRSPIYSALCNSHEDPAVKRAYALLQLQFLTARWKELQKRASTQKNEYCDLYESHAQLNNPNDESGDSEADPDFARNVRRTYVPALTLREMSSVRFGSVVTGLRPWLPPAEFVESFPEAQVGSRPELADVAELPQDAEGIFVTREALDKARLLWNYCGVKTAPRPGIHPIRDESYGGGAVIHGFVQYNDRRTGTEYKHGDPDDPNLNLSDQELIAHWSIDQDEALSHDVDPAELVDEDGYLLDGDASGEGTTPERIGSARTRSRHISIDKERMPWCTIHLRPAEIEGSLTRSLHDTAHDIMSGLTVERVLLQRSALAVTCMETGRPLEMALTLRRNPECIDEYAYLSGSSVSEFGFWQWKAITPLYRTQRLPVPDLESRRVDGIRHRASHTASIIMNAYVDTLPQNHKVLFPWTVEKVRDLLRPWLQHLDPSGRLTIPKLSRLQWSLLSQECGGDISEASLVLALPHPLARVPLFYSLLAVNDAQDLFRRATETLWGKNQDLNDQPEGEADAY
jgi:hypothetical protein